MSPTVQNTNTPVVLDDAKAAERQEILDEVKDSNGPDELAEDDDEFGSAIESAEEEKKDVIVEPEEPDERELRKRECFELARNFKTSEYTDDYKAPDAAYYGGLALHDYE